jgi:hypothetical protein
MHLKAPGPIFPIMFNGKELVSAADLLAQVGNA